MYKEKFNPTIEVNYLVDKIKSYFECNGPTSKAIIGISGGKDSTITAALLVRALGAERVVGVLMPEGIQEDIDDSYTVCKILGIKHYDIDIKRSCDALYHEVLTDGHDINDRVITNTPARIRMTTLYMIAAIEGGRVINTCNASEEYIGFSTKYGDLAGDFGVLKNYYVTEILQIGDTLEELPYELVHKAPSDGMCGQTDEDHFGFTYEELDNYLLGDVKEDYDPDDYGSIFDLDVHYTLAQEKIDKIRMMHKRNRHKENVVIPAPFPMTRKVAEGVGAIYENH